MVTGNANRGKTSDYRPLTLGEVIAERNASLERRERERQEAMAYAAEQRALALGRECPC